MIFKDSIQCGRLDIFSDESGWILHEGSGDRSYWSRVIFDKSFFHPPFVTVNLSGVDASKDFNLRLALYAHSVTQFGFDLEVRTWADSLINYAAVTWSAYEIVS